MLEGVPVNDCSMVSKRTNRHTSVGAILIGAGVGSMVSGAWSYFTPPASGPCGGPFACTSAPFMPGYSPLADGVILTSIALSASGLAVSVRSLLRNRGSRLAQNATAGQVS